MLAVSLEANGSRELQAAHVAAGCYAGDLSNVSSIHVGVRHAQVGMVKPVAGIGTQRERPALGELERLDRRKVLLDEMRTIQRSDGIVPKRAAGRPQERTCGAILVRAPGKELGAIPRRSSVGVSGSKNGPVGRPFVGL